MAKPRVFISSTFYDLKYVRSDLERFIKELGYEPIRNETGSIAYGKDSPLETYAYKELDLCDIIVSIIGGRYGTESAKEAGFSISQAELKRALENGIQVFIFIEKNVFSEYSTYRVNKSNSEIKYSFVDNSKVYEFIEELNKLPKNNPIHPFETSSDIIEYLRSQWSGLFQRFLQDQKRESELKLIDEMKSIASTLQQLVNFLTDERKNKDDAIQHILLANHPVFRRLTELTETPYRIFFTNEIELNSWLRARGWQQNSSSPEIWRYNNDRQSKYLELTIDSSIFDEDGKLIVYDESEWLDDWIKIKDTSYIFKPDDDLPF